MSGVTPTSPIGGRPMPGRSEVGHRALQRPVLAVPVVIVVVAGWMYRFTYDDGFIYLRIVRNLRSGHGPVFNVGERVETYTGTLWTFLLALVDLLTPIRLEWIALFLGLAFTAAGVVFAMAGSVHLQRRVDPTAFLVPAGALVYVAIMPIWVWTTSGLEIGLALMWLGGTWWILARWATGDRIRPLAWWQAVILGLGWLIRPELVMLSAVLFAVMVVDEWRLGRRRDAATVAVWMLVLPVAYQIFRMGYFGLILPNTALAKEGGDSMWSRGWTYLRDFTDQYWLWVPLIAVAFGVAAPLVRALLERGERRAVLVMGLFAGTALTHTLYVVRVGGDYLHARMLLPSFFMLCAVGAVVPLRRRSLAAAVLVPWAIVSVAVIRPAQLDTFMVKGIGLPIASGFVTSDDFMTGRGVEQSMDSGLYLAPVWKRLRHLDGATLLPDAGDTVIVAASVGLLAYTSPGVRVVDLVGLGDPLGSRFERSDRALIAGHEKYTEPEWVAARLIQPGTPVRPGWLSTGPVSVTAGAAFDQQVEAARQALTCPPLQQAMASATAPMSFRRFLSNVVHSFENTRLRIPNDPVQARDLLCGE